jgi:hypothetical protein
MGNAGTSERARMNKAREEQALSRASNVLRDFAV